MEARQPDGKGGGVGVGFGDPVAGNAGGAALDLAVGGTVSGAAAGLFEGRARGGLRSATLGFAAMGLRSYVLCTYLNNIG